jgi:hypothetical protein
MAPGPVRWPWMASSVPSETFPTRVRFRGWMSEAEGFLRRKLPAYLTWPARPYPGHPPPRPVRRARPPGHPPPPRRSAVPPGPAPAAPGPPCCHAAPGAVHDARLRAGCDVSLTPRAACRTARGPAHVPGGRPDSGQRIDGVSRLLPYSDLLALTSSGRRGEGVSDRGSWKRLRILLTGHVDVHASPMSKRARSPISPAWCLDR